MAHHLVSTVIPVFNRAHMLRRAVASVLAQTWRPIEIIIVDDGSTDDTLAVANELAATHVDTVRVISQGNAGPGAARQAGLDAAKGEFIQFLDSDDLLLPHKFALQVNGLLQDADAGISYGKTYTSDSGKRRTKPAQRSGEQHRKLFPELLTGRLWETSTPLYRRSALERIGPWPAKRQMEDWEFDAQAGRAGTRLHYCSEWIAEYVIHNEARLAHAWRVNDAALTDMVNAYVSIGHHAAIAGVSPSTPEMRQFARTLFWLARTCAARRKADLARQVLDSAASLIERGSKTAFQIRLYRIASHVCGWRNIGRLCAPRQGSGA